MSGIDPTNRHGRQPPRYYSPNTGSGWRRFPGADVFCDVKGHPQFFFFQGQATGSYELNAAPTTGKSKEAERKKRKGSRLRDRKSTRLNSSHIPLSRMPS